MTSATERAWITFLTSRNLRRVKAEVFLPSLPQAGLERYDRETDRLTALLRRNARAA